MSEPIIRSTEGKAGGLTGVVLAGGMSTRMGGAPKALLPFRGELLVQRQVRLMRPICSEIVLVANEPQVYAALADPSVVPVADRYPGNGPIGGMHAALAKARHERVWLVGCDMPFISPQAALLLLERMEAGGKEAAIPSVGGRLHPLHGLYDRAVAGRLEAAIRDNRLKLTSFVESLDVERVAESAFAGKGIDPRFVLNANTPEEYDRALRMMSL